MGNNGRLELDLEDANASIIKLKEHCGCSVGHQFNVESISYLYFDGQEGLRWGLTTFAAPTFVLPLVRLFTFALFVCPGGSPTHANRGGGAESAQGQLPPLFSSRLLQPSSLNCAFYPVLTYRYGGGSREDG